MVADFAKASVTARKGVYTSLVVFLLLSFVSTPPPGYARNGEPPSVSTGQPTTTDTPCPSRAVGRLTSGGQIRKEATQILLDQKNIWTSPLHINRSSAPWWIATGVGTAALLAADHPASQTLPFSGTTVHFGVAASRAGQWYTVFPAAGVLYATGCATHHQKLAETGMLSLRAMADADLVTEVLKVTARRQRPRDGDHGGHFEKGGSSFPSGHSTEAWALATVIASEYGDHRWMPYVSYGYATLVSVSRVLAQDHFASDVLVGGAIGFFTGRYVVRTQRARRDHPAGKRSQNWRPSIVPTFSPVEKTVRLTWTY